MSLIKWKSHQCKPFKSFFEDDFFSFPAFRDEWAPALDVSETKDVITVKADLPGLKLEDISVAVEDDVLTLKGERKSESDRKEKNYHIIERSYGHFQRSLWLGSAIDQSKIQAHYKNGVLEVVLPKSEQAKPKQIKVEV